MRTIITLIGVSAALAVACSASQDQTNKPVPPDETAALSGSAVAAPGTVDGPPVMPGPPKPADPAMVKKCTDMMDRSLLCADLFLDMLLTMRAELDFPAGIAAKVKKDKKGMIAEAKKELEADTVDPKRTEVCTDVARHAPAKELDAAHVCAQKDECEAFVACLKPVQRRRLEHLKKKESENASP